jgi:hypothetical protein
MGSSCQRDPKRSKLHNFLYEGNGVAQTRFPRQLNALQVATLLGSTCLSATAEEAAASIADFFAGRGAFSYDPSRRRAPGVISRQTRFEKAHHEVQTTGQPLGRRWNAELLTTIHNEYSSRQYRFRPLRLTFRPISDGLVLRIPCNFFVVEEQQAIFHVHQLSRTGRFHVNQVRFVLSATWHTLAKDDLASATAAFCDFSKKTPKGQREPTWYDLKSIGLLDRDRLNAILTNYMRGYALAVENGMLPDSAYRPSYSWEEAQYKLL